MAIVVNKPLPEFEANATGGIKVSNTSHNGKTMVLYFYPMDDTPGCTKQACSLRDFNAGRDFTVDGSDRYVCKAVFSEGDQVQLVLRGGKELACQITARDGRTSAKAHA